MRVNQIPLRLAPPRGNPRMPGPTLRFLLEEIVLEATLRASVGGAKVGCAPEGGSSKWAASSGWAATKSKTSKWAV